MSTDNSRPTTPVGKAPAPGCTSHRPWDAPLPCRNAIQRRSGDQVGADVFEASHLRELQRIFGGDAIGDRIAAMIAPFGIGESVGAWLAAAGFTAVSGSASAAEPEATRLALALPLTVPPQPTGLISAEDLDLAVRGSAAILLAAIRA